MARITGPATGEKEARSGTGQERDELGRIAVRLHGTLARHGGPYRLAVANPAEAVRALALQLPALREELRQGRYLLVKGPIQSGRSLTLKELNLSFGKAQALHLMPAPEGGGKATNFILGGVLLAASFFYPPAAGAGIGFLVNGAAQLLFPTPKPEQARQKRSALFSQVTNATAEGVAVPYVYGKRVRVGSVVIAAGLDVRQV